MHKFIENYQSGIEDEILKLFEEVFNRKLDSQEWYWRFRQNPYGIYKIKCMWEDNKLIGHTAFTPMKAYINGKITDLYLTGTSMMKKGYGGLFPILIKSIIQEYKNIEFFYGFPNNKSFFTFKKFLKWSNPFNIETLTLNITDDTYINSFILENSLIRKSNCFDEKNDKLIYKVKDNYSFIMNRDSKTLNWRIQKPNINYEVFQYSKEDTLKGYVIVKEYINKDTIEGDIVDILSIDSNVYKELIQFSIAYLYRNKKIKKINIWTTDEMHKEILLCLGFQQDDMRHNFCYSNNGFEYVDEKNIYLTMLDSDVF